MHLNKKEHKIFNFNLQLKLSTKSASFEKHLVKSLTKSIETALSSEKTAESYDFVIYPSTGVSF